MEQCDCATFLHRRWIYNHQSINLEITHVSLFRGPHDPSSIPLDTQIRRPISVTLIVKHLSQYHDDSALFSTYHVEEVTHCVGRWCFGRDQMSLLENAIQVVRSCVVSPCVGGTFCHL
uniref:AsIV-cont00036-ORF2 n=1 Tax=Apophua simplicipes ichnovirus TaxID=1329648 RepID=S5DMI3_9VIRU|nr:AsIV-cont00036-ORF2 [Apophua simplicipes ichnovirus]